MNSSMKTRIEKIEAAIPTQDEPDQEESLRWVEACEQLAATMDPAHLAIVLSGPDGRLAGEFYHRVHWHLLYGKPLGLPRSVAEIYLMTEPGDGISNLAHCRHCGYEMPLKTYSYTGRDFIERRPPKAPTFFFDECQLCGEKLKQ